MPYIVKMLPYLKYSIHFEQLFKISVYNTLDLNKLVVFFFIIFKVLFKLSKNRNCDYCNAFSKFYNPIGLLSVINNLRAVLFLF